MVEYSDAMTTNTDADNDQLCPICLQQNQCVLSRGQGSINDCWCMRLEE